MMGKMVADGFRDFAMAFIVIWVSIFGWWLGESQKLKCQIWSFLMSWRENWSWDSLRFWCGQIVMNFIGIFITNKSSKFPILWAGKFHIFSRNILCWLQNVAVIISVLINCSIFKTFFIKWTWTCAISIQIQSHSHLSLSLSPYTRNCSQMRIYLFRTD